MHGFYFLVEVYLAMQLVYRHSNNDNWKQTILSITYQDQKSLLAGDNQLVIYKQCVVSKL